MPTIETHRIADQLGRAVRGPAWHGPSMRDAITGLTADDASARPVPNAHTVSEIVAHVAAWLEIVRLRIAGTAPGVVSPDMDWPPVAGTGDDDWRAAVARLDRAATELEAAALRLDDSRLDTDLRGEDDIWTTYVSLHGAVQHVLYHAGQIVLLKKALRS